MKIFISPEDVLLRDGTKVDVRSFRPEDAALLQRFWAELPEVDRMYLRNDVTQSSWIETYLWRLTQGQTVPMVAVHESGVVGSATLYRRQSGWSSHVGEIRVAVAHDFQGRGLSKHLIKPLVQAGITLGLDQLIAHLVENQHAARRLLEGLGFRQDAVLTGRVKDAHGFRRDLIVMCNEISHVWDSMEALVSDYSPMVE